MKALVWDCSNGASKLTKFFTFSFILTYQLFFQQCSHLSLFSSVLYIALLYFGPCHKKYKQLIAGSPRTSLKGLIYEGKSSQRRQNVYCFKGKNNGTKEELGANSHTVSMLKDTSLVNPVLKKCYESNSYL